MIRCSSRGKNVQDMIAIVENAIETFLFFDIMRADGTDTSTGVIALFVTTSFRRWARCWRRRRRAPITFLPSDRRTGTSNWATARWSRDRWARWLRRWTAPRMTTLTFRRQAVVVLTVGSLVDVCVWSRMIAEPNDCYYLCPQWGWRLNANAIWLLDQVKLNVRNSCFTQLTYEYTTRLYESKTKRMLFLPPFFLSSDRARPFQ
jgi:hypothetical protein